MPLTKQILILALSAPIAWGQFTTGATSSDPVYSPTASGDFDPAVLGLNPSGDNVFYFSSINIPAGVTIRLRASKVRNKAVTWLVNGNVLIAGTLDLSGATPATLNTDQAAQLASNRVLPDPGPGGYTGGLGSRGGQGPENGAGPGGGLGGLQTSGNNCYGGSASFVNNGFAPLTARIGATYGTFLLIPLYGGSGGGGGWDGTAAANVGGTGGAGGGAIRIASNTQITVTGQISAAGGSSGVSSGSLQGCAGGSGSGGAVHLVAPLINGNGGINVNSGNTLNVGGRELWEFTHRHHTL